MMERTKQEGFTAAELLITLFIGVIFLIAGYQLYITVFDQSIYAHKYAKSSAAAQAYMNLVVNNAALYPTNCAALPATYNTTAAFYGQDYYNFTVTTSCPNVSEIPDLRSISVRATKQGKVTATHATYYLVP